MGVIFRASQRHSCRIVAVNACCVITRIPAKRSARFCDEAQAAASLDHPNILPIHKVSDNEDGLPFFTHEIRVGRQLAGSQPRVARRNARPSGVGGLRRLFLRLSVTRMK